MIHQNFTAALATVLCHMILLFHTGAASSQSEQPMSGVRCPPGKYVAESGRCTPCPAGTFQPHLISKVGPESCSPCPSGYYCASSGLAKPDGMCTAGYYCLPGSTSPTDRICEPNHHCPEGVGFVLACPPGTKSPAGATSLMDCVKEAKREL